MKSYMTKALAALLALCVASPVSAQDSGSQRVIQSMTATGTYTFGEAQTPAWQGVMELVGLAAPGVPGVPPSITFQRVEPVSGDLYRGYFQISNWVAAGPNHQAEYILADGDVRGIKADFSGCGLFNSLPTSQPGCAGSTVELTVDFEVTGRGGSTITFPAGQYVNFDGPSPAAGPFVLVADSDPPVAQSVGIASDHQDPSIATEGDTITLSLSFDEDLVRAPSVTIQGERATVTGSGTTWQARVTVGPSTTEGPVTFTVSGIEDPTGNQAANVTATTDGSTVTIDHSAPVAAVALASDNSDPRFATQGDTITLSLAFDEALANAPTVTIQGEAATVTGSGANWQAAITVGSGTATGPVTFQVTGVEDGTGNQAADITATTDGSSVTIDRSAPVASVSLVSNHDNPRFATQGNTVTLSLNFDEPLATAPTVVIQGQAATVTGGGTAWQASIPVDPSTPTGPVSFEVTGVVDASGNRAATITATTDSSGVNIDQTAPGLTITGVPDSFQPGDVFTVTFDFGEAVTGFDASDVALAGASMGPLSGGPQVYTATVTPNGRENVTVSVADGAAVDRAGNPATGASRTAVIDSAAVASEMIADFMETRARNLIANQPELAQFLSREDADGRAYVQVTHGMGTLDINTGLGPIWLDISGATTQHEDDRDTRYFL